MAKKIVAYEALGTTWQVHRDLIDSPGLGFVRDYLSGYDYSKLRRVRLNHSERENRPFEKCMPEDEASDEEYYFDVFSAYFGHCGIIVVDKDPLRCLDEYEAICYVHKHAPYPVTDMRTAHTKFGKRKIPFEVFNEDESVVAIVAHEVGHYLADTGQIPRSGRKVTLTKPDGTTFVRQSYDEVEAGEFTTAAVEAYRRACVTDDDTVSVTDSATHCLTCGMELSTVLRAHKFCSDACRWKYHSMKRSERTAPDREKRCVVCGIAFTAGRSDAKTCSPRCRQRLKRNPERYSSN